MLYLTCTTITIVDLSHYGVSRAKDWVSVDCGTKLRCSVYNSLDGIYSGQGGWMYFLDRKLGHRFLLIGNYS